MVLYWLLTVDLRLIRLIVLIFVPFFVCSYMVCVVSCFVFGLRMLYCLRLFDLVVVSGLVSWCYGGYCVAVFGRFSGC